MDKKKIFLWLGMLSLALMVGFYGVPHQKQQMKEANNELEGTWRLISYKYGDDGFFSEVPNFMEYRKILTKDHYSWVSYGENGDDVIGAGGGTYTLKGDEYTEHIEFFHPHSEDLIGASTTFESRVNGNVWAISGTIKALKLNPETGKKEVIKETQLSEVWERVE